MIVVKWKAAVTIPLVSQQWRRRVAYLEVGEGKWIRGIGVGKAQRTAA